MSIELGAGDINRNLSGEFGLRVAKTQYLVYMESKSKRVTFLRTHSDPNNCVTFNEIRSAQNILAGMSSSISTP
jgi:hypothetical protein